jgi:hypothetical protein
MLHELKKLLKARACEITRSKQETKEHQKEHSGSCGGLQYDLLKLSKGYRHHHIAYCLLRGTPYESIEKPREGNEPDMALIQEIRNAYTSDVCISQA